MMRRPSILGARLAAAALGLTLCFAATAHAQVGHVSIKGVRYVNGVASKVNCPATDGHTLDASVPGVRVFTIIDTCPIWFDTGTADELRFVGEEQFLPGKRSFAFSGLEQDTGLASGAAGDLLKCSSV